MKKGECLLCDAARPLICNSLEEEMLLYNISSKDLLHLKESFYGIGQRELPEDISQLSGGQKVLLMLCLALASPAMSIHFVAVKHSLDSARWDIAQSMAASCEKEIMWSDDANDQA